MDALRRSIEGADSSKAKAARASAKKTEVQSGNDHDSGNA